MPQNDVEQGRYATKMRVNCIMNYDRMDNISTIFPVFFLAVAALVCLTTMARMVEEQRTEIGTLKALGYTDREIQKKYLIYSLSATVLGSGLGLAVGFKLFPTVIYDAYCIMYDL